MPDPTWYQAAEAVKPYIVRISTPRGHGTGFVVGATGGLFAIATAAHVLEEAHYWEEPIRIHHDESNQTGLLRRADRAIVLYRDQDSAALYLGRGDFGFPEQPLPLAPPGRFLRVGNEIAWLGYPAVVRSAMCFFSGRISAFDAGDGAYLVDGVAINGVSGGPAFHLAIEGEPARVIGLVSAYVPNRATGEALPGLSIIRDVSKLHEVSATIGSLEEAKEKESPPEEPPAQPEVEQAEPEPIDPA